MPRSTVPFPYRKEGIVVLDLFSGVGTTALSLRRAGIPIQQYYSDEEDAVARAVQKASWAALVNEFPSL